jgi:hypothetical protein
MYELSYKNIVTQSRKQSECEESILKRVRLSGNKLISKYVTLWHVRGQVNF